MKWSFPFIALFVLSLVSFAHRAPPAEASHLVLQPRLPGVKWLCPHLSSEGCVQSCCARPCDSRWRPGGRVQRCWSSTMIWSHGQHSWACPVRTHPSPSWQESHTAVPGVLLGEILSSIAHSMDTSHTWQRGFPGGLAVENLPASAGDSHWSLGQADPLELKLAARSTMLAWEIPLTVEPGGLQSMGLQRVRRDWVPEHTHTWQKEPFGLWGLTGEGQ